MHEARLLEAQGPGPSRLGRDLALDREAARFGQRLTIDPDQLVARAEAEKPAVVAATRTMVEATLLRSPLPVVSVQPAWVDARGARRPARLFDGSFGLMGLHGPMPFIWTAMAEQNLLWPLSGAAVDDEAESEVDRRPREGEGAAFFRFLDVIHHRLFLARYRAWADARPAASHDPAGRDPFSRTLAALAGDAGAGEPPGVEPRLGVAGPHVHGTRSGRDLARMLQRWLGAPVHCEELVGEWLELARDDDRWVLGKTKHAFDGLMLGARSWERQSRFRLYVGPVDDRLFDALLPPREGQAGRGGELFDPLVERVREFVGPALSWDLYLRRHVPDQASRGGALFVLGRDALRSEAPAPDSWDDLVVDVEGRAARLPALGDDFAPWTPPRRLRAAKAAVDAALVAVSGEDARGAWQPAPALERALRASVLAALWGKDDPGRLAGERRQRLVRWFVALDHLPDAIPFDTFSPSLAAARGTPVVRGFARQLAILTKKTIVASPRLDRLIDRLSAAVH
jgi:type VI secretion system protein ImpH